MTEKEEVVAISIMVSSCISDIDGKTPKVNKLEKHINNNLTNMFKTGKTVDVLGRFGMATAKPILSQEYHDLEEQVRNAWSKTRKENIPKDDKWMVSMSELVEQFLNTLNRNPYQYMLVGEKTVTGAVNSFRSHTSGRESTIQDVKHARVLVDSFRENIGIKKYMGLARRKYALEQDLILEGKI